jgi:DNA polymerase I
MPSMKELLDSIAKTKEVVAEYDTDSNLLGLMSGQEFYAVELNSRPEAVKEVLESPSVLKVGTNLKDVFKALHPHGISMSGPYFDTGIAKKLLDPALEDLKDKPKGPTTPEKRLRRACKLTKEDKRSLGIIMEAEGVLPLFEKVEMPLLPIIAEMEIQGITMDREALEYSIRCYKRTQDRLKQAIFSEVGRKFEINNPEKLSEVLFNERRFMPLKKLKRFYCTDLKTLIALNEEWGSPLLQDIIAFKKTVMPLSHLYSYRAALDSNGRVHPRFRQIGAETGRMSCTKPNVQGAQEAIKRCIVASEGYVLLSLDYSQIQLRLLAHLSADKRLIELFNKDADIHTMTAAAVFGKEEDTVTDEERKVGKTVNFGVLYGQTPLGIAEALNISERDAEAFRDGFYDSYKRVEKLKAKTYKQAKSSDKATISIMGRKRYFRDDARYRAKKSFKPKTYRQVFNSVIQMAEADIVKLAMFHVRQALADRRLSARLVMQVHDSLVYECPEAEADETLTLIKDTMESAVKLKVPLKVDADMGYSLKN